MGGACLCSEWWVCGHNNQTRAPKLGLHDWGLTALCRSEPHMQRGHNVCRGGVNYRRVLAIHKDEPKYDEIVKIDLDSLLRSQADQHVKKQKLTASNSMM